MTTGMYVLKFRGAGQGPRALIAELVSGEIARALGLAGSRNRVRRSRPGPRAHRAGPGDPRADRESAGLNLALDYLPGSVDVRSGRCTASDAELASRIVWFDALRDQRRPDARATRTC